MAPTSTPRGRKKTARRRATKRTQPRPEAKMVRTSERSSFNACRWQWDRGYNDKLATLREAPALRFGSLIHAALELRYPPGIKRGPKPAETFERLFAEELDEAERAWGFRDADGEWADAGELGVTMLEEYVKQYGRDEEWKVIASEMTFKVPVYWPEALDGDDGYYNYYNPATGERSRRKRVLFYYVGTMDGVWQNRMDNGVRINDYKTTSGDPKKEGANKAVLDEQATAYWTWGVDYLIAKKVLKPKEKQALDGMLYTFLRKAAPDERPKNAMGQSLNKDGSVSKVQPVPLFHRELVYRGEADREHARERAIQQFTEMELVRNGKLAAYKSPGLGYPSQQCQACPFRDACELHEAGADWKTMLKATMTTWEPYAAHEVKEEGKWG